MSMTPGELLIDEGEHTLNPGRRTHTLVVQNASDRPIQVGSHYHFAETNVGLSFDRDALTDTFTNPPADAAGTDAVVAGLVTVTITGSGTLRYTDDGTTPVPGGATVQTYSAPIANVPVGTLIRASATATGKALSDFTQKIIT